MKSTIEICLDHGFAFTIKPGDPEFKYPLWFISVSRDESIGFQIVIDAEVARQWTGTESYLEREIRRHTQAWAFVNCKELFDELVTLAG